MQVPLGVLLKNENKGDEMVEIISHLHQYIPYHDTQGRNRGAPSQFEEDSFRWGSAYCCKVSRSKKSKGEFAVCGNSIGRNHSMC